MKEKIIDIVIIFFCIVTLLLSWLIPLAIIYIFVILLAIPSFSFLKIIGISFIVWVILFLLMIALMWQASKND